MGDATLKPSSGDDLVLSNDDGSAKIEVNEGAEINVTIGSASGDDFNVGSGKLVVEGDTGKVGVGTDSTDAAAGKLNVKDGTSAEVKDLITVQGYRYSPWQIRVDDTTTSVSKFQVGFSNNTEALSITDGGQVTITDGDLKIGTAGHGIDFSNQTTSAVSGTTPDTSGSAELLDHYEQGSFTLTNSGGLKSATQCQYIKIGRLVKLSGIVYTESSGTIVATYGGLPFNVANGEQFRGGGVVVWQNFNSSYTYTLMVTSNTNTMAIYLGSSSVAFGNDDVFYFTVEYIAGS